MRLEERVFRGLSLLGGSEWSGSWLFASLGLRLVIEAIRSGEHRTKTQSAYQCSLGALFCSGSIIRLGALVPAHPSMLRWVCRPSGLRFIAFTRLSAKGIDMQSTRVLESRILTLGYEYMSSGKTLAIHPNMSSVTRALARIDVRYATGCRIGKLDTHHRAEVLKLEVEEW